MTSSFEVVPAVDLLRGAAVRLERGDFDRVIRRESDPLGLLRRFAAAGARRVHVVDLDGARRGGVDPARAREVVAAAGTAAVQLAGGVRGLGDAETLLAAGAERVVVGTAALTERAALADFHRALGPALVVALDVRAGALAVAGWTRTARLTPDEAAAACAGLGVAAVVCTAVDRDGTAAGPDLDLLARVVGYGVPVYAAGGVRDTADLDRLAGVGCRGAIVGRALLDGTVPLTALAGPLG